MALAKKESDEIIKNKSLQAASNRRTATKIIIIVLIVALVLTGGTYGVMTFIDANSMRITISDVMSGLSLCEKSDFIDATTSLDMNGPDEMDACTYTWFYFDDNILGYDGAHHGGSYIAYSFYLKNVSRTNPCYYTMGIKITRNTRDVASALRIMVIENEDDLTKRKSTIYAKAREDGTAEYVSYNYCSASQVGQTLETLNANSDLLNTNITTPFLEDVTENDFSIGYYAMREKGKYLSYNSYEKYTLVIWLEGTDQQCVNEILGGQCSIEVEFEIEEYLDPEYYGQ